MIKELERVVVLLDALPETYQKEAADSLAWFLKRVENEMTMTKEEIAELERLRRAKTRALYQEFRELLNKRR
jgi:inactivated superfamily I helicase